MQIPQVPITAPGWSIGPAEIGWVAVGLVAAVGTALAVATILLPNHAAPSDRRAAADIVLRLTIATFISARLGALIPWQSAGPLPADFFEAIFPTSGTISTNFDFYGALVGGILATIVLAAPRKGATSAYLDVLALAAAAASFVASLGYAPAGELVGRPARVSWAVIHLGAERFSAFDDRVYTVLAELGMTPAPTANFVAVPRHPLGVYTAAGFLVVIIATVLAVSRRRVGRGFGVFVTGVGLVRLGLANFREPGRIVIPGPISEGPFRWAGLFPITVDHLAAATVFVVGLAILIVLPRVVTPRASIHTYR